MKKKILFLVLSIFIVVLILFSSSYALLFKTNLTDKQSYTTGVLDITSEALNGSVTLSNELPMTDSDGENTTPYIFRITNIGNLNYKFNIMLLSTTTNNQIEAQYIKIKVNEENPIKLSSLTGGIILSDIVLKPTEYVDITLRVWLDEYTPNTQIGKTFNAKITTEGEAIYTNKDYAKETLTLLRLTENTNTPDFSKTSCSDGCDEATVGIYKTEDDIGDSYYFRGDVENNYVYFAGFYWRIIRINGDGTIRMIYDNLSNKTIGSSEFNILSNDNAYVGYMYGTSESNAYSLTHSNINNPDIKQSLDAWYNEEIKDTIDEQYVADAIYCNDREVSTADINYTGDGSGTTKTSYKPYERLYTNKTPTLKCNQANDRFTVNSTVSGVTGNGKLTNAIGLITADEVAYAGGTYTSDNSKYYLYNNDYYWTMSSFDYDGSNAREFIVSFNGNLDNLYVNNPDAVICFVISISGTALNAGTGTKNDPFKIDAAKNTLTQLGLTENTDTPDFSKTSCSDGCGETTVGIYKTEDDIGDSYYFRGDVENNYVYFAGFYWRIIRINGDGSIRMIYAGTSAHENGYNDSSTNDMNIGTSAFNSSYNDNAYVGFMYGATGSSTYAATHANTNNSTIKTYLDNWYYTNIKGTTNEQYIADAIYCNDRELQSGTGTGTTETNYKAYNRLYTNKTPTLKCNQVNDRFTVNLKVSGVTGNGALTYPIGLITADEGVYAGGVSDYGENNFNFKYYLYNRNEPWTMTAGVFTSTSIYGKAACEFSVSSDGNVHIDVYSYHGNGGVFSTRPVRPVISISGSSLNSGDGTMNNPFKIQ